MVSVGTARSSMPLLFLSNRIHPHLTDQDFGPHLNHKCYSGIEFPEMGGVLINFRLTIPVFNA